jgi:hypothetical protein
LTSPCELSEREVTSPSNLKVVGALDNYSLVFVTLTADLKIGRHLNQGKSTDKDKTKVLLYFLNIYFDSFAY